MTVPGLAAPGIWDFPALVEGGPDGERCAYCGKRGRVSVDHVLALSSGGPDDPWNLAPACRSCNASKGNREVESWLLRTGRPGAYYRTFVAWRDVTLENAGWVRPEPAAVMCIEVSL